MLQKENRRFYIATEDDRGIKLWVETGWIPFLKSAMAGTRKCSVILQSTKTIKYSQMAMEINSKKECHQSFTIQDTVYNP